MNINLQHLIDQFFQVKIKLKMYKSQSYETELSSHLEEADFLNVIFGQQHNLKSNLFNGDSNDANSYKKFSSFTESNEGLHQSTEVFLDPFYAMTDSMKITSLSNDKIHERWEPGEIFFEAEEVSFGFRRAISEPGTPHKVSQKFFLYFSSSKKSFSFQIF